MNKKVKIGLIVAGSIVILAILVHLIINYAVPFVMQLHGAPAY